MSCHILFKHWNWVICLLLIGGIFSVAGPLPASAQEITLPGETVLICVQPLSEGAEGNGYLYGFTSTEFPSTTALGFVLSEQATVTVYSHSETLVTIGVYHITPHAQSGGYSRDGHIATVYTSTNMPTEQPCGAEVTAILGDTVANSIPLPVSSDQAFLIQVGSDDQLGTAEFLGTFAIHFTIPETEMGLADIQVIQMDTAPIELLMPYLSADTRFALISNKEVWVKRSFTFEDPAYNSGESTNPRDYFVGELSRETPPIALFELLNQHSLRFFPAHGVLGTFPTGGLLRFELSPVPAIREPEFSADAGQTVRTLDLSEIKVRTFLDDFGSDSDVVGNLDTQSSAVQVVGIDNRGHLLVRQGDQEVVIEAWLVEVE